MQEATHLDRPFTTCYVLMSVIVLFLETGDLQSAEDAIDRLLSCAAKYWLVTYSRAAVGWRGWLATLRGDLSRGIELLQTALAALHEDGYELYRPHLSRMLGEALAKSGQWTLAYATVCDAIAWCERCARTHEMIDLLRLKGEILGERSPHQAEACLLHTFDLARQQGLVSLELRIGISLARLWRTQGLARKGLELLASVYGRFADGSTTSDLIVAADLLEELRFRLVD
jgi:hypothetical protein